MWQKLIFVFVMFCVLMFQLGHGQDVKVVLDSATKAMGDVKSL